MTTAAQAVHTKAIEIGKRAVRATTSSGGGHLTTALSLAQLTAVLTCRVMPWGPAHPDTPGWDPDRLMLSEGHAVQIIHAAYAALVLPSLACRLTRQPADGRTASSWRVQ